MQEIILSYTCKVYSHFSIYYNLRICLKSYGQVKPLCFIIKHLVLIDFIIVYGTHKNSTCNTIPKPRIYRYVRVTELLRDSEQNITQVHRIQFITIFMPKLNNNCRQHYMS